MNKDEKGFDEQLQKDVDVLREQPETTLFLQCQGEFIEKVIELTRDIVYALRKGDSCQKTIENKRDEFMKLFPLQKTFLFAALQRFSPRGAEFEKAYKNQNK